jgi:hypothetical protein
VAALSERSLCFYGDRLSFVHRDRNSAERREERVPSTARSYALLAGIPRRARMMSAAALYRLLVPESTRSDHARI